MIHNFNNLTRNYLGYGGAACEKEGVIWNGENWILKYPGNLKSKNLKGVDISYANDAVSEYLGSHIFAILGMDAQETLLGIADDKLVVLCKDFCIGNSRLIEFRQIKVSSTRDIVGPRDNDITNGEGTSLLNTLKVIRNSYFFEGLNTESFFWKMFIIDYLIDNPDRNNGNWGIILKQDTGLRAMAPIYDCGNSLSSKWDDAKCEKALADANIMEDLVWRRKVSFFTEETGKRIHPFSLISSKQFPICTFALDEILSKDFNPIYTFLEEANFITDVRKEFYITTIKARESKLRSLTVQNKMNIF